MMSLLPAEQPAGAGLKAEALKLGILQAWPTRGQQQLQLFLSKAYTMPRNSVLLRGMGDPRGLLWAAQVSLVDLRES